MRRRLPTSCIAAALYCTGVSASVMSADVDFGDMNPVDRAGLLRLRDAQPTAVVAGCDALRAWGTALNR
jgi:hypothetical protein